MLSKIMTLFSILSLLFGFIPSTIIAVLYDMWIVLIILIFVLIHYIFEDFDSSKMKYGGGIILFSFISNLCWRINSGTDDSLGGLNEVVNSMVFASFFAILATICLVIFITILMKEKKQKSLVEENKVVVNNKNYCTACGSKVEGNNRFCTNCGKEL